MTLNKRLYWGLSKNEFRVILGGTIMEGKRILVVSAHAADYVWRSGGTIAKNTLNMVLMWMLWF